MNTYLSKPTKPTKPSKICDSQPHLVKSISKSGDLIKNHTLKPP